MDCRLSWNRVQIWQVFHLPSPVCVETRSVRILLVALLAGLGAVFLQLPALSLAVSAMVALLSAGMILFETSRIVNGGETNYVSATLAVYLDVYNVFVSLLNLIMAFGGDRD